MYGYGFFTYKLLAQGHVSILVYVWVNLSNKVLLWSQFRMRDAGAKMNKL